MALTYGSYSRPVQLRSVAIGAKTEKSSSGVGTTILRVFITIAEVAAALIPGIDVVAETAVAFAGGSINEILDYKENNISVVNSLINFGAPLIAGSAAARFNLKAVRNSERLLQKFGSESVDIVETFDALNKGVRGKVIQTLQESNPGKSFTAKEIREALKDYEDKIFKLSELEKGGYQNLPKALEENKESFKKITKLNNDEIEELISGLKVTTNRSEQSSIILGFLRNLSQNRISEMINSINTVVKNKYVLYQTEAKIFNSDIKQFLNTISKTGQKITKKDTLLGKFIKFTSTPDFNRKFVQRLQLIDPNDLGRAPIEASYQYVKKLFKKQFKNAAKIINNSDHMEEAFLKTGGRLVSSEVILGYKIIKNIGFKNLVMISFKPVPTYNKEPVFVYASDIEITQLANASSPMNYYLDHWAFSRGGKKLNIGINLTIPGYGKVSLSSLTVLSFIPVQTLRNVLSIASNWVENISDMVNGKYKKNYKAKLIKSFRNTAFSRTFRFFGRVLGTQAATNLFGREIGRIVGIELQRLGTQVFNQIIKNKFNGDNAFKGIKKALYRSAAVSIRSHTLRRVRQTRPGSVVAATLSARRKLKILNRPPNAFTPGRPYKGIKIKRR